MSISLIFANSHLYEAEQLPQRIPPPNSSHTILWIIAGVEDAPLIILQQAKKKEGLNPAL